MKVFRDDVVPLRPTDTKSFLGRAQTKLLASTEAHLPTQVYRVEFEPGGRTHWHRHSGPQWLFIVSGRVRVQRAAQPPEDVGDGDAVLFEPGEKHWHGASPGCSGAHIAVNVNVKTEWLEPVSDEDYAALLSASQGG